MAKRLNNQTINQRVITIVAFIFALAYVFYCLIYWGGALASEEPMALLAIYILTPHFIAAGIGCVLTALALFLGVSWWNLAAGFVYIIGICFFPAYWFFLIVPCVLSFVAFYVMRKREKRAQLPAEEAADERAEKIADNRDQVVTAMVDKADDEPYEKAPEQEAPVENPVPSEDDVLDAAAAAEKAEEVKEAAEPKAPVSEAVAEVEAVVEEQDAADTAKEVAQEAAEKKADAETPDEVAFDEIVEESAADLEDKQ